MRKTLWAIVGVAVAVVCWGLYGKLAMWGQAAMPTDAGQLGWLRPLMCIGLSYFVVGLAAPIVWFYLRGEGGHWSVMGVLWALAGGAAAALGTLGVLLAFRFSGRPVYVMPLVFGGTAVVHALLSMFFAGRRKEIGATLLAGLIMVVLGAVVVFIFAPAPTAAPEATLGFWSWLWWVLAVALAVVGWGAFGPMVRQSQVSMGGSWFRPLLVAAIAALVMGVFLPSLWLSAASGHGTYTLSGTLWSLLAGAAGAAGVVGAVVAYQFGVRPVYVLPVVLGGAPILNTLFSFRGLNWGNQSGPLFLAGLILLVAGSALALVLAKRGEDYTPPPAPGLERSKDKPRAEKAEG